MKDVLGHLIEAERRGFTGRIRLMLEADNLDLERWDPAAVAAARHDCANPAMAPSTSWPRCAPTARPWCAG